MRLRLRSLQAQLAIRLAAVILVATALGIGAIVYEGMNAADALGNEQLARRAEEIAQYVAAGSDGTLHLELPPPLEQIYHSPGHTEIFALRAGNGRLIAESEPGLVDVIPPLSTAGTERHPLRLEEFGATGQDYYGLVVSAASPAGPVTVLVARASDADALAHALLQGFVRDVAWVITLFAAATLAVGAWSIRRGLRPVRLASERAASITPDRSGVRLPVDALPTELEPLAAAVNHALDRLEQAFAVQRQFTANAAHEIRTPLAILTAGLEALEDSPDVGKLRNDAARINRLVAQLLRVARLDAAPVDTSKVIDLQATAAACVEYLAPWAIERGRALGFEAPESRPVPVHGDAAAVTDALRNLIENAVTYAPVGTEVTITVDPAGYVSVSDRGPGVAAADRPHIFERFWRGRDAHHTGAGLGLAIVAEIARAHDGTFEVDQATGGGALFVLKLRRAESAKG
jgi:two-component system, OmpR family, sensor histidine kinase TctE